MYRTRKKWDQVMLGAFMLGLAAMVPIILLSNKIGIGKALGLIALGVSATMWIITGIVLVLRGLNKT